MACHIREDLISFHQILKSRDPRSNLNVRMSYAFKRNGFLLFLSQCDIIKLTQIYISWYHPRILVFRLSIPCQDSQNLAYLFDSLCIYTSV